MRSRDSHARGDATIIPAYLAGLLKDRPISNRFFTALTELRPKRKPLPFRGGLNSARPG